MPVGAQVFNIQRFSIQDGPGIRTTVFFQGCPLECAWCHNPEGKSYARALLFHRNLCRGCLACRASCPEEAILSDAGPRVDRGKCTLCMKCVPACLYGGLAIAGASLTVAEVFAEVRRDSVFYRNSHGGVTASGGEPLVQQEAVVELFRLCHDLGLETALDTCGHVSWDALEQVSEVTDLFLYDLKGVDPGKHTEWTGVDNGLILDNLRRLCRLRPGKVRIRIPFVPGFNDSPEDIRGMAELLAGLPVEGLDLLPYHGFAEAKYRAMDLEYAPRLRGLPDYDFKAAEVASVPLRDAVPNFTIGG